MTNKYNNIENVMYEEKLITEKQKKQKKHYLNPNAKSFVHKFLKVIGK